MAQIKATLFYYIRTKGFICKWKLLTVNIHIGNHRTFFYLRCCHNARGRVRTGSVDPEAVRPSDWTYCSQKPEWEKMQIYLDEMKCKYIFIFGKSNSARQSLTYLILIIFNIFWKIKNEKSQVRFTKFYIFVDCTRSAVLITAMFFISQAPHFNNIIRSDKLLMVCSQAFQFNQWYFYQFQKF